MLLTADILLIVILALILVLMVFAIWEKYQAAKYIREKYRYEYDESFTKDSFSKEMHFRYALENAPHSEYDIYRKCPYSNEFETNTDCEIWTCPAYGDNSDGELTCKGLIKKSKNEKSCFVCSARGGHTSEDA